uniref:Protein cramped-like n=1 Tax=Denticeps clupeoides TaxID=299321 RepID=A0AAY4BLI2_9TELE
MTVGHSDGLGVEGPRRGGMKAAGCEDEEGEEPSTKRDEEEIPHPATSAAPSSTPNPDQHHFLRSSVRPPSKRLRKDSLPQALNGHGATRAKGGEASPAVSASAPPGPVGGGPGEKEERGSQKRTRRQWESWSTEDKSSFFEGLYEHGKDFEAIQNNIALKYKKKGKPASMVKNKEQVRHFYYRTWHKISKHIDFNNAYSRVLKKSSQELYGLICYAELRKKVGGLMDDKNVTKLNELIQQGATTVRSKGRNLRIKAPMCRALKKLCDPDGPLSDEEDQKPVRLPLKVAVELQPRNNHSWARVQSLAHNPRLRMMVELHRKVSSLIEFLKQKWAVQDERIRKSLVERESLQGLPQSAASEELLLFPTESSTVMALPGVARVVHSKVSCTVHWQESGRGRPGVRDLPAVHILGIQPGGRGPGRPGKSAGSVKADGLVAENSDCSAVAGAGGPDVPPAPPPGSSPPSLQLGGQGSGQGLAEPEGTPSDPNPSEQNKEDAVPGEVVSPESAPLADPPVRSEGEGLTATGRSPEQIREAGWSVRGSENVTLAELYLMLGKPGKLQLEYDWQPKARPPASAQPLSRNILRCLLRLVSTEVNPKPALEVCSVGTSPIKPGQEDQSSSLTPPGKTPAGGARSPSCGRQQSTTRTAKLLLLADAVFPLGGRNLSRPLIVSGCDSDGGVFAVPTTLPPNSSRHSRMFSPNKEAELAFRQQLDSISSDIFLPKQRKLGRCRPLRKPLRTLLPRTTGDTSPHVCSFSILSNSSATGTGSFRPIQSSLPLSRPFVSKATPSSTSTPASSTELSSAIDFAAKSAGIIPNSPCRQIEAPPVVDDVMELEQTTDTVPAPSQPIRFSHTPLLIFQESFQNSLPPPSPMGAPDSLLAPPSVASLLDISLPGPPEESLPSGEPHTQISDSIIELAINSAQYGDGVSLSSAKLNGNDTPKLLPSPSDSPARSWIPSPTHDPQWYPSDSTDSTLGCLLSSLVSPDKVRRAQLPPVGSSSGTALLGPSLLDSNSHDSFQSRGLPDVTEVDSQLACMMSESSVDYIARFNDLAQELSVTESPLPPPGV